MLVLDYLHPDPSSVFFSETEMSREEKTRTSRMDGWMDGWMVTKKWATKDGDWNRQAI